MYVINHLHEFGLLQILRSDSSAGGFYLVILLIFKHIFGVVIKTVYHLIFQAYQLTQFFQFVVVFFSSQHGKTVINLRTVNRLRYHSVPLFCLTIAEFIEHICHKAI